MEHGNHEAPEPRLPPGAAGVLVNHSTWHALRAYYVLGAVLQPLHT